VSSSSAFSVDTQGGVSSDASGTAKQIKIGDYILLGKYNDEPIVWRCVDIDENGPLMLSDKKICNKMFGMDNFWETSYLRKWLNSTASQGEVQWMSELYARYPKRPRESYDEEKGFLNVDNFSQSEKKVMKTVSQWTMLPSAHLDLATNKKTGAYNAVKEDVKLYSQYYEYYTYYEIPELPDVYSGAAYQVSDTVFLLDEMQLYNMYMNLKSVETKSEYITVSDMSGKSEEVWTPIYWLRTPSSTNNGFDISHDVTCVFNNRYYSVTSLGINGGAGTGVRPAFYLDTDNSVILSGKGKSEEPYIIDSNYFGEVVSTDITAQIGDNPIPSYNIDGDTAISVEDLSGYGFDVKYDNATRTLNVNRSEEKAIAPIDSADVRFLKNGSPGSKLFDICRSDIKVYLDGEMVDSFNIDGRTFITIDDLGKYGTVVWDGNGRMISVNYRGK